MEDIKLTEAMKSILRLIKAGTTVTASKQQLFRLYKLDLIRYRMWKGKLNYVILTNKGRAYLDSLNKTPK